MKWTLGLLLMAGAGCGYHETKMVACPETGCPQTYAASSPQGLRTNPPRETVVEPMASPTLPPPEPEAPLPDTTPPPPDVPVPTP